MSIEIQLFTNIMKTFLVTTEKCEFIYACFDLDDFVMFNNL